MKIIGFGHKSRQGKDLCAQFLINYLRVERQDLQVERVGFADKLKDICQLLFPQLHDRIYYENNPLERDKIVDGVGKTPVQIWIEVGNKIREVWMDVWVELLFERFDNNKIVLIIPDVRYLNEIEGIRKRGGVVVKVCRDGVILSSELVNSVSDNALNDYESWDYTIRNDGGLEKLYNDVINLWKLINK